MNVKEANEIIAHASELLDYQVSKRGLLESQLFPVTAYICVSFYNSYDILYDILKRVYNSSTQYLLYTFILYGRSNGRNLQK